MNGKSAGREERQANKCLAFELKAIEQRDEDNQLAKNDEKLAHVYVGGPEGQRLGHRECDLARP